jgi:manganese/zinc/iron transport system substrate-binding protein
MRYAIQISPRRTPAARPMSARLAARPRTRRAGAVALLGALLGTMLVACGGDTADADGLNVVATIGMIGDAAANIGGDHVRVTVLMGPGVDPHMYKASAGDVRRLAGADLILYNGLHLEAAMADVLAEMGRRGHTVAVAEAIPADRRLAPPEFAGAWDPHVWFDVSLWLHAVEAVADALVRADPAHEADYRRNAAAYAERLEALHAWVLQRAAELPAERRVLVTAHDAFNYFGRAYGFEVRGLQGINTAAEAGTADVQQLAAFIAERRIPAMFVETSVPRRTIEAVQAAVRARGFEARIGDPLFSDAMGDAGTEEGTYIGMIRHNVNTIVGALMNGSAAEPGAGTGAPAAAGAGAPAASGAGSPPAARAGGDA